MVNSTSILYLEFRSKWFNNRQQLINADAIVFYVTVSVYAIGIF